MNDGTKIITVIVVLLLVIWTVKSMEESPVCYELADGSGRTGEKIGKGYGQHILRMDDTGKLEKASYTGVAKVECKEKRHESMYER